MQENKKQINKIQILKVMVGSRAHNLADKNSDTDYRSVHVNATTDILAIGHKYRGNHWVEGEKEDQTSYEIGHFLKLAIKCNPTILEVFKAPIIESKQSGKEEYFNGFELSVMTWGEELQSLFPHIWTPEQAFAAFVGYSSNQRKKMLDKKDDRGPKFACAYLRTLWHLNELLATGNFSIEIPECGFKDKLREIRKGNFRPGDLIDHAEDLIADAKIFLEKYELGFLKQEQDLDKVHKFLMKIRKQYWELPQ